ncbi:hypothetical protein HOA59_02355 [archaeon]|jgi:hypothetical protein|nr:hypothetical protein [archaeon]MBT6824256.1 hypothetical protein [archaeon]MBT7106822.1 hypothetical protein [archaeon]
MQNLEKIIVNTLRKANYTNNKRVDQFLVNLALYSPLGILPGESQEKYAEKANIPKTKITNYSAGLGVATGLIKLALADKVDDYSLTEFLGMPTRSLAIYTLTDSMIRLNYANITGKPMGTLLIEGYRRTKDIINKKE